MKTMNFEDFGEKELVLVVIGVHSDFSTVIHLMQDALEWSILFHDPLSLNSLPSSPVIFDL